VLLCVEDLCPGKQLVRFRSWPCLGVCGLGLFALLMLLSAAAATDGSWVVAGALAMTGGALMLRALREAAYSQSTVQELLCSPEERTSRAFSPLVAQSDPEGT
jgi:hypothetical protein